MGVIKVRNSCEAIQHYGNCHEADGSTVISKEQALDRLSQTVKKVKDEYNEAAATLRAFFGE